MKTLRDHSQSCEHGKRHTHASIPPGEIFEAWCPGGREVTIDYEAAGEMLAELRRIHVVAVDANHSAQRIVDAAIGRDDASSVRAAIGTDEEASK